jgi:hypothetical protein
MSTDIPVLNVSSPVCGAAYVAFQSIVGCHGERGFHVESVSYEMALAALIRLADKAHLVKILNPGVELWRTGRPLRLRLYVSHRLPGLPQLVTVLRRSDSS